MITPRNIDKQARDCTPTLTGPKRQGPTPDSGRPEHATDPHRALQRYFGNHFMQTRGVSGDRLEREADRIATQVTADPIPVTTGGSSLRLQRFPIEPHGQGVTAPESVDQVIAGPGKSMEPGLREEMEHRFDTDFSSVRVHADAAAGQSARAVNADAYTIGHHIVFDTGRFASEEPRGRRLLAHELTHVMQQSGNNASFLQCKAKSSEAVFQQSIPDPDAMPNPLFPSAPSMPLLQVVATPSGGLIIYKGRYKVKLRIAAEAAGGKIPFAYLFSPATPPLVYPKRNYPIINVIAGPGVSIELEGFPGFYALKPENTIPEVKIIRVQSLSHVPRIGTPFNPADYESIKAVESSDDRWARQARQRFGLLPLPPDIAVHQRFDGLDIVQVSSKEVLRIKSPNLRGDTAYAYEVIPQRLIKHSRMQRVLVKLIKTPSVEVKLHTPFMDMRKSAHGLVFGIVPIVYEVDSVKDVPLQGQPIPDKGRQVGVKHEMQESLNRIVATAAIDTAIGVIPVVGDLVDIAEFTYGVFTGYDRWGRSLSKGDLALMGIGALLPFVSGGLLKGAARLGKALNRDAEEVADLVRAVQHLNHAERSSVEGWTDMIRHGRQIPDEQANQVAAIVRKMDDSVAGRIKKLPAPVTEQAGKAAEKAGAGQAAKALPKRTGKARVAGRADKIGEQETMQISKITGGALNDDTVKLFRQKPALRHALAENNLAAQVLKKCNTPCFPPEATPEQISKLNRKLKRLSTTGPYNEKLLKEYLYRNRNNLGPVIDELMKYKTSRGLNNFLKRTVAPVPASPRVTPGAARRPGPKVPVAPQVQGGVAHNVAVIDYSKPLSASGYSSSFSQKGFGVFEGRIPGVKDPVAIKVYPKNHSVFAYDLAGAEAASRTGKAAKFYGEVDVGPGKRAFAMEKVPGGFPDARSGASRAEIKQAAEVATKINKQTVADLRTYGRKLLEEGFYYAGEVQGLIDNSGRWRAIDFQPIRKLPPKANAGEYAEALKRHWDNINDEIKTVKKKR